MVLADAVNGMGAGRERRTSRFAKLEHVLYPGWRLAIWRGFLPRRPHTHYIPTPFVHLLRNPRVGDSVHYVTYPSDIVPQPA